MGRYLLRKSGDALAGCRGNKNILFSLTRAGDLLCVARERRVRHTY